MEAVIELLDSNIIRSFSWSLIHSFWQGIVIVFIVFMLLKIVRQDNAQMKYFILTNAMFVFLLSVFVTFTIVHQGASHESTSLQTPSLNDYPLAEQTNPLQIIHHINKTTSPYLFAFILFWLTGVFILFLRFLFGILELKRLRKSSPTINNSKIIEHFNSLNKRFSISKKIKICSSTTINSPLTFGFFKPIIVIPISLLSDLSIEQIELIITHELIHIKRKDYLVNVIQSLIEILFFFNPTIWWLSKNIRKERENCCDDGVLEHFDPLKYSQTLTQVESNRIKLQEQQLYLSASNNQNLLLTRIKRIMKPNPNQKQSNLIPKLIVSFLLFSCILMISWIAPNNENTTLNSIELPIKASISNFNEKINSDLFNRDTSYIIATSAEGKLIAEATAQLKSAEKKLQSAEKNELTKALNILSEKKKVIAEAEKKIQVELNVIMADSGNTITQEIALIKDLEALEKSDIQIQKMEHAIEKFQLSLEVLKDSSLSAIAEQSKKIKEQSKKVVQQSKKIAFESEKMAQQSKKMSIKSEKMTQQSKEISIKSEEMAQQSAQFKKRLELIENELLERELINDRSKYNFKISKTELYINGQKQSQELFDLFNSLLEKEEIQITKQQ